MVTEVEDRRLLAKMLATLPADIASAELDLHTAYAALMEADTALEEKKAGIIVAGLEGKNEEERKARLRLELLTEYRIVDQRKLDLRLAEVSFSRLKREFRSAEALVALISGKGAVQNGAEYDAS